MSAEALRSLVLIVSIGAMSPFIADIAKRWTRVPGVVVEIVGGSLKVQALEGHIRSYNAVVLKKLYGRD